MRLLLLAASLALLVTPARAAYQFTDIACETSETTGTGTLDLAGAKSGGYLGFAAAGITSGNTVPYTLTTSSGVSRKVETGFGVFTDAATDTLTRVAQWSTDGSGAELNLSSPATVCIGPIAGLFTLGAGSTVDADLLDGISSSAFATDAEVLAGYQPLDSDLTSWAGVTRASGLDTFVATPSSANFASLVTDDAFSLTDAELTALAGLTSAADKMPYFTGSGTAALADISSSQRTFQTTSSSANLASWVTDDLFALSDVELGAIAGLVSAADKIPYFSGSGTAVLVDGDGDKGDITVATDFSSWTIDADTVALTTDTTGDYVAGVADGTGVDGTASGEGSTSTPSLDFTEITAGTGLTATNATTLDCDTANTTTVGCVEVATQAEADAKTAATVPSASVLDNYSRGLIWGLTTSNNGTDAVNDIDIAVGVAASVVAPYPLMENTTSALTKRLDAAWAVGDAAGGLDGTESSGGTPDTSTWYHVYLIQRSDTGVVDVLFSENATTPSIDGTPVPAAYDHWRRIGSVFNDSGGDIDAYWQTGDVFRWVTAANDKVGLTADEAWGLDAITVPLGVMVQPIINGFVTATTGDTFQQVGDARDTGATNPQTFVRTGTGNNGAGTVVGGFFTNTSSQIHFRFEEATDGIGSLNTLGWIDLRGRLD
jgi:hypothetical protein